MVLISEAHVGSHQVSIHKNFMCFSPQLSQESRNNHAKQLLVCLRTEIKTP